MSKEFQKNAEEKSKGIYIELEVEIDEREKGSYLTKRRTSKEGQDDQIFLLNDLNKSSPKFSPS